MASTDEEREEGRKDLYDTMEEERYLLRLLFSKTAMSRKFFSHTNEEVFTSNLRLWLFRAAYKIYRETKNKFKEDILESELDRIKEIYLDVGIGGKFLKKQKLDHDKIRAEYNMIMGYESCPYSPEWLIQDLEKKHRAKLFMESAEKAVDKVLSGESDEAITDLNSDLIKIKSGVFTEKPLRKLSDASWQIDMIKQKQENPDLFACLRTGFESFDSRAGFFKGELTLITAHTGVGKSTLMRSMALGAAETGLNVLFIVNEEIEDQAGNKFSSMYLSNIDADFQYRILKKADKELLTPKKLESFSSELQEFGKTMGEIYIQELPQFHTCADIEQILVELQQKGERIDILFLDYLDHLKPMEKTWSETDEQNKAVAEFKNLAMQFRIAAVTATQADTQSADQDDMSAYNVRGSKQKSGASNIVIAIKEIKSKEQDDSEEGAANNITWRIIITKNRDGPKFSFFARFYKSTGVVREFGDSRMNEKELKLTSMDIATYGSGGSDSKKASKKDFKKDLKKSKDTSSFKKEVTSKTLPIKEEKKPASAADAAKEMEFDSDDSVVKKPVIKCPVKKTPKKISRSASCSKE
jgi:replicative DNA helicase